MDYNHHNSQLIFVLSVDSRWISASLETPQERTLRRGGSRSHPWESVHLKRKSTFLYQEYMHEKEDPSYDRSSCVLHFKLFDNC